jgi:hypothetical protein
LRRMKTKIMMMTMMEWTMVWVKKLGGDAVLRPNPIPEERGSDGEAVPNPPIFFAGNLAIIHTHTNI